ncbi:hypothetical protein VK792_01030 [Mesobacterium sp. TK19101]|uniref:Uncharacterized protein n=1 Tax=Mesobacterium hydrothermale TaxID=3111907 RepID=A0ABU6HEG0_9RHOB|nr:hypothetical protein [Mesobacterium sp. TK19101]MEC3859853.1 hypothetical protein [Mesobacterium sp. TK19101]
MLFRHLKARGSVLAALGLNLLVALAPRADAAEFLPGGDAELGCFMTIRGQIVPGDAERFRDALTKSIGTNPYRDNPDFIARFDGGAGTVVPRICLDSAGGSLAEALRMSDVLTNRQSERSSLNTAIGTAVAAGARCHSACAVLFMAGGSESEGPAGRLPNRVLHAQGSLGFHAPGLTIPDGNYTAEAVDKAFTVAVRSIGELSDRQADLRFPATLLNRMVATPPQEMYVLSTVGEAAQWMIDVVGLPHPARLTRAHFVNVCLNTQSALMPATSYLESYANRLDGPDSGFFAGRRLGDYAEGLLVRHYNRGVLKLALGAPGDFGTASFVSDPDPAEDGLNCEATFGGIWPQANPLADNNRRLAVSFSRGGVMFLDQAAFYPPWTRFADLSREYGTGALQAEATVWSDSRSVNTRCIVFDANDTLTDNDACRAVETARFTGAGEMVVTLSFTWPSGAKTVIGLDGDQTINGNSATSDYIAAASDLGDQITCLRNSASGNAFCFDRIRF